MEARVERQLRELARTKANAKCFNCEAIPTTYTLPQLQNAFVCQACSSVQCVRITPCRAACLAPRAAPPPPLAPFCPEARPSCRRLVVSQHGLRPTCEIHKHGKLQCSGGGDDRCGGRQRGTRRAAGSCGGRAGPQHSPSLPLSRAPQRWPRRICSSRK